MKKSKFSETQIVAILKQADAGVPVKDICRQAGISVPTYYQWKSKYGGMEASDLKRVKELEAENAKIKRVYADLVLDVAAIKDLIPENCRAGREARGGAVRDRGACTATALALRVHRIIAGSVLPPAAGLDGARRRADRVAVPTCRGPAQFAVSGGAVRCCADSGRTGTTSGFTGRTRRCE